MIREIYRFKFDYADDNAVFVEVPSNLFDSIQDMYDWAERIRPGVEVLVVGTENVDRRYHFTPLKKE